MIPAFYVVRGESVVTGVMEVGIVNVAETFRTVVLNSRKKGWAEILWGRCVQ